MTRGTQNGFVSAGHCGKKGDTTTGFNRAAQGVFQASSFPVNDQAWVAVNANWTPRPVVNNGSGGTVSVAGSREAIEGASVCRSGSTTDWQCGVIRQRDASVTYPQGTVFGLTRTSVCAEPGDSGGSFISVDQAQGVTSGGFGDCVDGGCHLLPADQRDPHDVRPDPGDRRQRRLHLGPSPCTGLPKEALGTLDDGQATPTSRTTGVIGRPTPVFTLPA